ncbi:hypothetical protein QR680_004760 [Steinernema hermaphroditum]|uniref:Uncharacterized protein n=1 Tax=Steinernema hermaphroditum TaxID=289476 RepID=A0AA39HPQ9_9BILA|nr:hypothetical protein QR680_004760 [Steinernema hermaphroditum]
MAADEKVGKTASVLQNPFEEQEDEEVFEQEGIDKWINILLCRSDVVKEKLTAKPVSFLQLFRFATRQERLYAALGVFFSFICGAVQPILLVISGVMVDVLMMDDSFHSTELWNRGMTFVAIFFALGVVILFVAFLQYYLLKHASFNVASSIRKLYIQSILRQEAAWMDTQKAGTLISQLNENIDRVRDGIGDKIGLLVRSTTTYIVCIGLSFYYDFKMTLIMVGVGPLSAILMSFMARMVNKSAMKQMANVAEAGGVMEECILHSKTVASCNGQPTMIAKYAGILKKGRFYAILTYMWNGLFDGFFYLTLYSFFAAGFYYGGFAYLNGWIARPGDLFVVATANLFGSYFLGLMSPHLVVVLKARVAAAVIYKIIDRKSSISASKQHSRILTKPQGSIEFRNVRFSYPTRKKHNVLSGLSWIANPGDTVALVGHSGCGKSTSIGLLTRLYECQSGKVLIDGHNVEDFDVFHLRNVVGVVEQEPLLFNGTIAENIRFGNPNISEEEMIEVCRTANAHDFIDALSMKYDTVIGPGGVQLSGGQKQRIAIARAISRNPKILLLDEATSALDAESEIVVQSALKKASEGRTTVVIAHRLSTLRDVDRIFVIDKGIAVESGSHSELLSLQNGIFAEMFKAQQFKELDDSPSISKATKNHRDSDIAPFQRNVVRSSQNAEMPRTNGRLGTVTQSEPNDAEQSRPNDSHGIVRLYANCHGVYPQLILAFVVASIRGLEFPFYAFLLGAAFDTVKDVENENYLGELAKFSVTSSALGLFSFFTIFASATLFGYTAENVVDRFRLRAFTSVLYQDASFFDRPKMSAPNVITTISTSAPAIKGALDNRMIFVVQNLSAVIFCTVASIVIDYRMGLAGLVIVLIVIFALFFFGHQANKYSTHDNDALSKAAVEIVEQVRTIQLLTREETFMKNYSNLLDRQLALNMKSMFFDGLMFAFAQSFIFFSNVVVYGLGIVLIYYGHISPSNVYLTANMVETAAWCVVFVSGCLGDLLQAGTATENLLEIIETKSTTGSPSEGTKPGIAGRVDLDDVDFAYPSRPDVKASNGLSLKANPGETIALIGPSGGGKSTVVNLLERFYECQKGNVRIDYKDIKQISLSHIRKQMALVGQEPVLFSGSIFDNVRLGMAEASLKEVKEACQIANASAFIEAMPLGYDTEVGERGAQLSGGQKQRIALARALVRNPRILLLDEATSALDAESERIVQRALDVAQEGRTCITIAHRLSSIQNADRIYVIKGGRVAEVGKHCELLAMDGLYAELVRKQDLK